MTFALVARPASTLHTSERVTPASWATRSWVMPASAEPTADLLAGPPIVSQIPPRLLERAALLGELLELAGRARRAHARARGVRPHGRPVGVPDGASGRARRARRAPPSLRGPPLLDDHAGVEVSNHRRDLLDAPGVVV